MISKKKDCKQSCLSLNDIQKKDCKQSCLSLNDIEKKDCKVNSHVYHWMILKTCLFSVMLNIE